LLKASRQPSSRPEIRSPAAMPSGFSRSSNSLGALMFEP
jgi:hypothetical protein